MATDQPTDVPRALVSTVYLHDEDGRTSTTLRAGTVPSPEQAARITNPRAWEPEPLPPVA